MLKVPPPIVDCCKLIAFAVNDEDVTYTGKQCLLIGSLKKLKPIGEQDGIVIVKPYDQDEYLMGFCNKSWRTKGVSAHKSIDDAKTKCELFYSVISKKWQNSPYSEKDIEDYLIKECGVDPKSEWWA